MPEFTEDDSDEDSDEDSDGDSDGGGDDEDSGSDSSDSGSDECTVSQLARDNAVRSQLIPAAIPRTPAAVMPPIPAAAPVPHAMIQPIAVLPRGASPTWDCARCGEINISLDEGMCTICASVNPEIAPLCVGQAQCQASHREL